MTESPHDISPVAKFICSILGVLVSVWILSHLGQQPSDPVSNADVCKQVQVR